VDAWGVDYALLDARGNMLRNAHCYRDHRTDNTVQGLTTIADEHTLFKATGVQTMSINTVYQLASHKALSPSDLEQAATLLMIPDLFSYLLCGEKRAEYSEASTSQIFNTGAKAWAYEVIDKLGLPRRIFPEVVLPGTKLGPVRQQVLDRCGISAEIPVIAVGSHDTASALTAIPELDNESVCLSSGTWSLMGIQMPEPQTSDDAFRLGFTNEGAADGSILLLKNLPGLWVLQECMKSWTASGKVKDWFELEEILPTAPSLVSIIDLRAPEFQAPSDMVKTVQNYCAKTGQPVPESIPQIARCIMESLSLLHRDTVEDLRKLSGRRFNTVRVVGGGSSSRFLCQATSDACGLDVLSGPVEAAALGNGIAQAIAVGEIKDFQEARTAVKPSVLRHHYTAVNHESWHDAAALLDRLHSKQEG
jgi:rhamnulokinase